MRAQKSPGANARFELRERLAIYPRYIAEPDFLADGLRGLTTSLQAQIA